MCSLEESDEAYQFLGFPGYNPHLSKGMFQKFYDKAEKKVTTESVTDSKKLLLINSQRVFNIAAEGSTWEEREDLARTYFEMVHAVELGMSPDAYLSDNDSNGGSGGSSGDGSGGSSGGGSGGSRVLMQIYQVNEDQNIYGFRPILRYGYLYHRLLRAGYLIGKSTNLKKRIDWTYFPPGLELDQIDYICGPSYFQKAYRKRLQKERESGKTGRPNPGKNISRADLQTKYLKEPNWYHWPELLEDGKQRVI